MKKITLALSSSLACLFLLSACTDTTAPTTTTKTNTTQTGATTVKQDSSTPTTQKNLQNASLTVSGEQATLTQQSTTSTQPVNPVLQINSSEVTLPPAITELDQTKYSQAQNELNQDLCNEIANSSMKENCLSSIEILKNGKLEIEKRKNSN